MSGFFSFCPSRTTISPVLGVVLLATSSITQAANFNGNLTLTSDYVWRGSTQSQGDPAAQAGFRISDDAGFYASVWGSSIAFAPGLDAHAELDLTVGWNRLFADDWNIDVNVLRYRYPGTTADLDWTELDATLTWRGNYWLSTGWSNDALGYGHDGVYAQMGARFPLNDRLRIETLLGHYFLSRAVVSRSGYTHAQVNAIWTLHAPFELRLSAHATDAHAKAIFGSDQAGLRLEAALQASF